MGSGARRVVSPDLHTTTTGWTRSRTPASSAGARGGLRVLAEDSGAWIFALRVLLGLRESVPCRAERVLALLPEPGYELGSRHDVVHQLDGLAGEG
jgi:hypothetical protein